MDFNPGMTAALNSLNVSYTVVGPQNFATTSFTGYNVIWLDGFSDYSPGTPGNPGFSSANLVSFMNAGGVVFVQNPGFGTESLSSYPFGSELGDQYMPTGLDTIRITNPSSPVNANLTSASLSNWGPSAYGTLSINSSFSGVTDTGTDGDWVTVVLPVGSGELVYTEQGISERLNSNPGDPGAVQFLGNVIGLATPEPSSLALMAAAGVVLVVSRKIRR